ncbi:hypothetical protein HanPI659440_Chr08g0288881 [Helianthus annuus]|nr:hypothetical protein HanPI659440_Chr08g0288881 [Helianthus annuus]
MDGWQFSGLNGSKVTCSVGQIHKIVLKAAFFFCMIEHEYY